MQKNKIVFIVPYFGKLPGYFHEWAYTAGYLSKQDIDFLLITDIEFDFPLPNNVFVKKMSFAELNDLFQSKFNFKISLNSPYKLCDFKPAFGYLFNEYISQYDFWGNCDIDQIWGNVKKFITDDILNNYDRIEYLGHFTLYRNREDINHLYKLNGGIYSYQEVFSSENHYAFDEITGLMDIVIKNNIKNYTKINFADISPVYSRSIVSHFKNYKHQIFYWDQGQIFRKYIAEDGSIKTDEFMYLHFQKKNPKSLIGSQRDLSPNQFLYSSNEFKPFDDPANINNSFIIRESDFISTTHDKLDKAKYIISKLRKFLTYSVACKKIWIKQKAIAKRTRKSINSFKNQ